MATETLFVLAHLLKLIWKHNCFLLIKQNARLKSWAFCCFVLKASRISIVASSSFIVASRISIVASSASATVKDISHRESASANIMFPEALEGKTNVTSRIQCWLRVPQLPLKISATAKKPIQSIYIY